RRVEGRHTDLELHLVADKDAVLDRLVPDEAELLAVDGERRVGAQALLALAILADARDVDVPGDGLGHAADRELASDLEAVAALRSHRGALETDLRMVLRIEEVRRAQVAIALLFTGVHRVGADDRLDARALGSLGVVVDRPVEPGEAAADRRD